MSDPIPFVNNLLDDTVQWIEQLSAGANHFSEVQIGGAVWRAAVRNKLAQC